MRKPRKCRRKTIVWDPKVLEQTKLSVLGDAAAFRASVNLLTKKAEQTPPDQGLDFALFDCSACHHDLKQPSWRQMAGYEGPPGRPGIRRWSPSGLDLCLWYASDTAEGRKTLSDEFDAKMGALRFAFTNRPYGDAAEVTKAGQDLVKWTDDKLLPGLNKPEGAVTPYGLKASIALLKQLATDAANPGRGKTPDFDGARQTAWTFRAIYEDVSNAPKDLRDDAEASKAWQALQDKQKEIQEQLDKLATALSLNLPNADAMKEYEKNPQAFADLRKGEIEKFLRDELKQEADYNPQIVRDAFTELAKLLP